MRLLFCICVYGWLVALDKAGMRVLLDLPCSGELHGFSMPTVMYTSLSASIIGQWNMHVVPSLGTFVTCVYFYL